MSPGFAVLGPIHVQCAALEIDLFPSKSNQLANT